MLLARRPIAHETGQRLMRVSGGTSCMGLSRPRQVAGPNRKRAFRTWAGARLSAIQLEVTKHHVRLRNAGLIRCSELVALLATADEVIE
jgi:hypothetical protein